MICPIRHNLLCDSHKSPSYACPMICGQHPAFLQFPRLSVEGIASCTHHTPEQLRLPFHTAKGSHSTVHYMGSKNMVQLCRGPARARFCPLICFIWKTKYILVHPVLSTYWYILSTWWHILVCTGTYQYVLITY